ncbi:MAG: ATP-binding protein [Spirochaetes bacterium]|nr:ATP-binding protein [Spirochaetota bacterium]
MKARITKQQFLTNSPALSTEILFCDWIVADQNNAGYTISKGVCFIPADLSAVAHVRSYIERIAESLHLSEQSTFELSLVADELVTNAILASFAKNGLENIVLKWSVHNSVVSLTVLDYGGGFKISDVFEEIPRGNDLSSFLRSLKEYREARKAMIPLNGNLVEHLRFGRGLRIISNLVRRLDIEFHDVDGTKVNAPSKTTVGSIVTVDYVAEAA